MAKYQYQNLDGINITVNVSTKQDFFNICFYRAVTPTDRALFVQFQDYIKDYINKEVGKEFIKWSQ